MSSLYERLGGEPAIRAAVETFYRKMLVDDRVGRFFDSVDMDGQIEKQAAFLTMAFGGPAEYSGKDLAEGHAHLLSQGLGDEHVDVVLEHLAATLRELGVGEDLVKETLNVAETTRDSVLGRPTS